MIQNKLKSIEDTICWINQEEALFKFPQSSYQDVGDINTIQSGEGKMKVNIEPYARLFNTVLKWQKAQKKWTDGSFLELNAIQIETDINSFSRLESSTLFITRATTEIINIIIAYTRCCVQCNTCFNISVKWKLCKNCSNPNSSSKPWMAIPSMQR